MISNFLNSNLLQQYLNRNFAQPTDTGMPVQNKLYQQPFNMFDVSGGITNIPTNIDQQPFSDYYGPTNIDTSFGVANEEDVEEDVQGARRTGGLADLFRTILGFAVPGASLFMGAGRGALEGIQSLNQRFRNTMFGQSATGAEFFQKLRDERARQEAAKRGEIKELQSRIDRGDFSGDITSPAAKAAITREAARTGQYDRNTGGGGISSAGGGISSGQAASNREGRRGGQYGF